MFALLATWPLWAQIGIVSTTLAVFFLIARFGNMFFQWGRTKFGLGNKHSRKKNSCGECVLFLFAKAKKHESDRNLILDRVLKDQMNAAEQKIIQFQLMLFQNYISDLNKVEPKISSQEQEKQYSLYCETLKNAMYNVKDEIRRSFKENGFHELSGIEYSKYVKEKAVTLTSIAKTYMIDHYPRRGMAIELSHRFLKLDLRFIEDSVFELYNKSKKIVLDAQAKIDELDNQFKKDIDNYVEVQKCK